jgi:hypothetical protein
VPARRAPGTDVAGSSRTILELVATVMDAAFETIGEGVILGTLPPYMERFGAKNAQYINKRYVDCDAGIGALSALTPINMVSRLTKTPFTMVEATKARAVKRLHSCEFAAAFESKAEFPRAMICMLHKAAYQGSVNGLLQDPAKDGYDVDVQSRILFGDAHCDFLVESRSRRPKAPDKECPADAIPPEELDGHAHDFYTAILVAFVDYMCSVLPPKQVDAILEKCARKVGVKLEAILQPRIRAAKGPGGAHTLAGNILSLGGRAVERVPSGNGDLPVLRVTSCPYAHAIVSSTRNDPTAKANQVRNASCLLCKGIVQGAADKVAPGSRVELGSCLTAGDADCRFRIVGGGASP